MPKVEIDYSNTIFYKIFCKDPTIKELYVGLTTNFVQRKHSHKQSCKNERDPNHNCKLYKAIRNAGGWDNWQMEIIAFHNCKDSHEAHKKEQEYFETLGATLNSIEPLPKPKEPITKNLKEKAILYCEPCNIHFSYWKAHETHNNTQKHNKLVLTYNNQASMAPKKNAHFVCASCNFKCYKKYDYDRHISTLKHVHRVNGNENDKNDNNNALFYAKYICHVCNNHYKHASGLSRHKKTCNTITHTLPVDDTINYVKYPDDIQQRDIIIQLISQNKDFKELLIQQSNQLLEQTKTIIELSKHTK